MKAKQELIDFVKSSEFEKVFKTKNGYNYPLIKMPMKYDNPEDIDKAVMVKFPGARGGQGYFICSSYDEFQEKIAQMKERNWINDDDVKAAHIEEYVCGTNFCIHYFYSALKDEVEVLGMDSRYETNIDGIVRIPAQEQMEANLSPSYVVSGNHPVVIRESLLPQVFKNGDQLVETAKELVEPGMNGPFCLQCLVNDDREIVIFEMSARIDGGTNTFMNGSAYSYIQFGEPMSMGRRISREIKNAIEEDKLDVILT
jgi:5-formaminoimidazole-4-carboxamide-1-(beta)-D-ribofuranosyl 5'-monophosphate synthetase